MDQPEQIRYAKLHPKSEAKIKNNKKKKFKQEI